MQQIILALLLGVILAACASPQTKTQNEMADGSAQQEQSQRRPPTDAEVEQYNAMVEPDERIVCRDEVNVGSNIPVRRCRLIIDIDETSTFHRDQLRRALR
jgi:PBP1b-binding outer membrane lipoprotein LpoB